jgi:AraC-like DNA-binding protein
VSDPLAQTPTFHRLIDAADTGQAEDSLRLLSPNVKIAASADLRHRLAFDGDDRFSIGRLEFAGRLCGTEEPAEVITVVTAVGGQLDWEVGDETGTGSAPWLQAPGTATFARFGPVDELALFLPARAMRDFACALYGDDGLELGFDGARPIDATRARSVSDALRLAREFADADSFEFDIVRASLYRLLTISVLEGFRLRGDRSSRRLDAEARLRRYRVAAQFIDDYASLPITPVDVARAADVCLADLDDIFSAHSPGGRRVGEHLRRTRLAAAHQDLLDGDPGHGDTVAAIAHRWGFPGVAAFANLHSDVYGVSPRRVLER